MRQAFSVALLAVLLAFTPSALAQHSSLAGQAAGHSFGGHFGGGFVSSPGRISGFTPRGFSPAPSRAFGLPGRAFNPGRSFVPQATRPWAGEGRPIRPWSGDGHRPGDGHHHHDRYQYRSPYRGGYGYGYGYPYAYANSWQVLPWDLGYPDFTGYGDDTGYGYGSPATQSPDASPSEEPATASMDAAQPEYRPDYDVAPPPPDEPPAAVAASPVTPEPALTLIFKDGRQQTIHNYMLTPSAVIVLDQAGSGRQMRIPLDEINVTATQQAARQAGLDFHPPA